MEQIAIWEGRTRSVIAETLMHLGFEVYNCLLGRMAKLEMPEGLPAVPGVETLIAAVGMGELAKEAARNVERRSRELADEARRDRERAD